jgi:histidinol-phosphatase
LHEDQLLARRLASEASQIALSFFDRDMRVRRKPDGTEVTEADFEIERHLVASLAASRPGDGVLGEELGGSGCGERRWILDPIDGTANFIAGRAQWGTHIALQCNGDVVLGVISRPVRAQLWWASRGEGAFAGPIETTAPVPTRLHVSSTSVLRSSVIAVWAQPPHATIDRVSASASVALADLDAILQLAEGKLDGVIDLNGKIWDHAPAAILVEEAGGSFSDREGERRIDRGEVRYTNGHIHEALAHALAG